MGPLSVLGAAAAALLLSPVALSVSDGYPEPQQMLSLEKLREAQYAAREAYLGKQETASDDAFDLELDETVAAAAATRPANFSSAKAKEFYVDGASIPHVDWDVGPSYAGLLPISGAANETRKLFFWFFPAEDDTGLKDLIFWTNGGPGCSSLEGLLQENGPFLWNYGTYKPEKNHFSWNKLANVIWVEQPVGTGFTQGTPNIQNEHGVAKEAMGFMGQFLDVFPELKGSNFYVAGESYAGRYVPYITHYVYENPKKVDLKMKGSWMNDPEIAKGVTQSQIPVYSWLTEWNNVINLPDAEVQKIKNISDSCGYTQNLKEYLVYPPKKGPIPLPFGYQQTGCNAWGALVDAALKINYAFNYYHALDTPPILWDVLGFPGSSENVQHRPLYFNIPEVQKIIHAPNVTWAECSGPVFPKGDHSKQPSFTVLPSVIENNERTLIIHGRNDFLFIAEGARLAIQNMTWGGMQGFQKAPVEESFVVPHQGPMGIVQEERGLTYVEVDLCGHMVPQYQPRASFRLLKYLLGRIDSL